MHKARAFFFVRVRSAVSTALLVAIAALELLCAPPDLARGEEVEPLDAMIVNESYQHMHGYYDMYLNGTVLLIGICSGGYIPYSYSWSVDGVQASMSYWFNYTPTLPGEHTVRMEVTDVVQQFASDSLVVRVWAPVPTRLTTWGRIKALYR